MRLFRYVLLVLCVAVFFPSATYAWDMCETSVETLDVAGEVTFTSSFCNCLDGETITIEIRSSRWLLLFILVTHMAATVVVFWLLSVSLWAVALLVAVLFSGYQAWKRFVALNAPQTTVRLKMTATGRCTLYDPLGRCYPARLLGSSFISPRVTVLNFSLGHWRRRHLVLLPDNVDPEEVRRLRVCLRLGMGEPPESEV